MTDTADYTPPKVWAWQKENGGGFANINRPIAGPTHDKELPVGRHPLQLYSLATPNGQKVTIMLEELLALGHSGAEYDAWLIRIGDGEQFGSGFCGNQSKFENSSAGGSLGTKTDPRFPDPVQSSSISPRNLEPSCRSSARRAPNVCHGYSGRWAARPMSEAALGTSTLMHPPGLNTLSTVLPWKRNACSTYWTGDWPTMNILAGSEYTIADVASFPWYGGLMKGWLLWRSRIPGGG